MVARSLSNETVELEAAVLADELHRAERRAPFLAEVTQSSHGPSQVSMVLLKRADYRAMLSAYQRYQRHMTVVVDDPVIDAPLADVPGLYELWGTLKVAEALTEVAAELGFRVDRNELVRRRRGDLRLVSRGSIVQLVHPERGTKVRLRDQPRYSTGNRGLHSISFQQIPDVSIEITRPNGDVDVFLFDPKYKLEPVAVSPIEDAEGEAGEALMGGPKKVDIDKMHAYRDAIRRSDGSCAVAYAAIMYPGEERLFVDGLEALQCRPNRADHLEASLHARLSSWLTVKAYEPAVSGS